MANITLWFPVAIYHEDNLFSSEQNNLWNKKIIKLAKQGLSSPKWHGNTITSHLKYELYTDADFKHLFEIITDRIHSFARQHNSLEKYTCNHAWFNLNKKNTFQEFHCHDGSIFSGVYYIDVPDRSGGIIFDDPKNPDMLPVKNVMEKNDLTYVNCRYDAIPGRLIIFRSYLRHCVEVGYNTVPRISISFNYH